MVRDHEEYLAIGVDAGLVGEQEAIASHQTSPINNCCGCGLMNCDLSISIVLNPARVLSQHVSCPSQQPIVICNYSPLAHAIMISTLVRHIMH